MGEDYEAALRSLPEPLALALRLHDAGATHEVIGEQLHIEPEGVSTLLDLAHRKLDSALHRRPG
ncbi:hypothetical protein BST27_29450 [Mycobacterium intermedium]|uniref:RNA polymerase sigma factor 70 region 4 type 2 domain-containing protein n=1 Tax=Mycobacterium intermedium TaxID=28445 RepID=A0A1E3S384_MYCIE|nr:hypothetical protein [Mycobacterium intermedium]MCV6966942.1 hypothetical protein [Mycobacterium intermedium]ODQ96132.1 hypothetical protein BHQ20_29000 [Mycobacterium intermedium]OPE45438.1 hypothetical protein BV508_29635 [Mycobacterium intermedium]ORA91522.1 hypothetical protein BST27_29450 [Mycobacterium intermedium]